MVPPDDKAKIEVHVRRRGEPYCRVQLSRSPATIGRGPETDVHLDSKHVSRVHARLHFDDRGLRLVDAGSTNGFLVRGRRLREATILPDDVVEICDYQITARRLSRLMPVQLKSELSAGWLEPDEEVVPEVTVVNKEPAEAERPELTPLHKDPTIPAGSMLNRLAYLREELATVIDEDLDEEELEEYLEPDVPPLLVSMHEEANALLYNEPHAALAVEVIQAIGDRVTNVELLRPGDACWWGGKPAGAEQLWVVPTAQRFPMVTCLPSGDYQVQTPDDPAWKMFQRGRGNVIVLRSGPLLGCRAEPDTQMEITFGPFISYVRCVRVPPKLPVRWVPNRLRPDRWLALALVVSLAAHGAAMAVPVHELPRLAAKPRDTTEFVEAFIAPLPQAEPAIELPALSAPPPKVVAAFVDDEERGTTRASQPRRKTRRLSRNTPVEEGAEKEPDRRAQIKSVSISDFKVSGMIEHLPTIQMKGAKPLIRGGASILRGDTLQARGILSKHGAIRARPKGRLAEKTVLRVVNANAHQVERCYNRSLEQEPTLRGRLEVEWIVERGGTVSKVRIPYDDVGSPAMSRCVREAVRRWVFPPPMGGAALVAFPFEFTNLRR